MGKACIWRLLAYVTLLLLSTVFSLQIFSSALANPYASQTFFLRYPLLAMPEEHISYTVYSVNGSLWAKVDGVFPMYKIFGKGETFCMNGVRYEVLTDDLLLVYPTPPGTVNISIKMDFQELSWSNYTEINPEEVHPTPIGSWSMVYCRIDSASEFFTLKIHYEHPIQVINGSYAFLYDLNISPYLSPWSNMSKAFFMVHMKIDCTNLQVHTIGEDGLPKPVDYTIIRSEDGTETASFQIVSEYTKKLPGDILVKFSTVNMPNEQFDSFGSNLPSEHLLRVVAILMVLTIMILVGYVTQRKVHRSEALNNISLLREVGLGGK